MTTNSPSKNAPSPSAIISASSSLEVGLISFGAILLLFAVAGRLQTPLTTSALLAITLGLESLALGAVIAGKAIPQIHLRTTVLTLFLSFIQISLLFSAEWWGVLIFALMKSISVAHFNTLATSQEQPNNTEAAIEPADKQLSFAFPENDPPSKALDEQKDHAKADQWQQQSEADGVVTVSGELTVQFKSGQVQQEINIPFVPVLPAIPELEAEAVDGDIASVTSDSLFPYGCRLMVRREDAQQQGTVTIAYQASAAAQQSAA